MKLVLAFQAISVLPAAFVLRFYDRRRELQRKQTRLPITTGDSAVVQGKIRYVLGRKMSVFSKSSIPSVISHVINHKIRVGISGVIYLQYAMYLPRTRLAIPLVISALITKRNSYRNQLTLRMCPISVRFPGSIIYG